MSSQGHTSVAEGDVHRALSSPVRRRLLERLQAVPDPQDVRVLADSLELHPTTVRSHLAILVDAGLAFARAEDRNRVGRPRLLYAATAAGTTTSTTSGDGYRLLAGMLASYLSAAAGDSEAAGEDAGRAWGRHLVEGPAPFQTLQPTEAIERVMDLLDGFGFAPELDGADERAPTILLHRCPFLDVAREHQDVVCSLHLGLMRGALDELGVQVQARDLRPFVQPDLCVADLQVTA